MVNLYECLGRLCLCVSADGRIQSPGASGPVVIYQQVDGKKEQTPVVEIIFHYAPKKRDPSSVISWRLLKSFSFRYT